MPYIWFLHDLLIELGFPYAWPIADSTHMHYLKEVCQIISEVEVKVNDSPTVSSQKAKNRRQRKTKDLDGYIKTTREKKDKILLI